MLSAAVRDGPVWAPLKFRTLSMGAMMISEVSNGEAERPGAVGINTFVSPGLGGLGAVNVVK